YKVGGTCVIRGCVPKKLLVYGAHFAEDLDDAAMFGWDVPTKRFDWVVLRDNVLAEVSRIEAAYTDTLTNHDVTIFHERAELTGPKTLRLVGGKEISAEKILIATGATPVMPKIEGIEHAISSNEVFNLNKLPKRIVIAGGGYIANEFAGIFHQFGSHVTLVNRTDVILRQYDQQIVDRLMQISIRKGIEFRFHSTIDKLERRDGGTLHISMSGCDDIEADALLFAVGRKPNTGSLGLDLAGVEMGEKGQIKVDADNRSNVPSIFAVGDVTDRIQLTPVAIREGQAFADTFFGNAPHQVDYDCVPNAVFSHPPLAGVGMTEGEARNKLGQIKTFTSDFRAMKNALAGRDERSLYKLVVDGSNDRIVGIHMIGPDAPEILQAAAIAVRAKLKKSDFDATVALHPTMAEELVLMR
ncbi:MAG: glutathione reductase, partial [Sphingomonadales bacterium]|nr:glutathione reductase [Sphingomonadales bacterium]